MGYNINRTCIAQQNLEFSLVPRKYLYMDYLPNLAKQVPDLLIRALYTHIGHLAK